MSLNDVLHVSLLFSAHCFFSAPGIGILMHPNVFVLCV